MSDDDLDIEEIIFSEEGDGEFDDSPVGRAATELASLSGVVKVTVGESDGHAALAVRIDPGSAVLQSVHDTTNAAGLNVVNEEWDREAGHLLRVYRDTPTELSRVWYEATEELAALAADYSPPVALDYWMLHRGARIPENASQSAWGRHRGVTQQAIADNLSNIEGDPLAPGNPD